MLEEWSKVLSQNAGVFWRASAWEGLPVNLGINRYSSAIPPAHPFLEKALFPSLGFFFHQETPFSYPRQSRKHRFLPHPPLPPPKLFCERWITNFGHLSSKTKHQRGSEPLWQRAGTTGDVVNRSNPPEATTVTECHLHAWQPRGGSRKGFPKEASSSYYAFVNILGFLRLMSILSFILNLSLPDLLMHSPSSASEVPSPPRGHDGGVLAADTGTTSTSSTARMKPHCCWLLAWPTGAGITNGSLRTALARFVVLHPQGDTLSILPHRPPRRGNPMFDSSPGMPFWLR